MLRMKVCEERYPDVIIIFQVELKCDACVVVCFGEIILYQTT